MEGILVHPKTKQEAKLISDLFDKMNIAYEKGVNKRMKNMPNETTRKAIKEAREGKGEKFDTLKGLFEELKK